MERGKYSALDIAKWFLYYNRVKMEDEDSDLITNLKLQKLLYYAQGTFLAIKNRPLFNDEILAWEHGPVVKAVYDAYKSNHSNGIVFDDEYKAIIDEEDENLLKEVYRVFGRYSAWGLREMTHQETPWKETKKNHVISQESIKNYFVEHYVDAEM